MAVDDATERWLPVVGFEGLYEVSDLGRVRSLDRTVVTSNGPRRYRGRLLKPYVNKGTRGYPFVGLSRPGRDENWPVHRVVAEAFLGPCPPGREVCHGPGGKLDASLANLSYGTRSENVGRDRVRDGQDNRGERHGAHKLMKEQVLEIRRRRAEGAELLPLAQKFNVSVQTISGICTGRNWSWLEGETSVHRNSSRLTEAQVLEIRQLRAEGWFLKPLAVRFGVTFQTISNICTRKTWNDV